MATGLMVKNLDMEYINGSMKEFTKVAGLGTKDVVMGQKNGTMGVNMKAAFLMA